MTSEASRSAREAFCSPSAAITWNGKSPQRQCLYEEKTDRNDGRRRTKNCNGKSGSILPCSNGSNKHFCRAAEASHLKVGCVQLPGKTHAHWKKNILDVGDLFRSGEMASAVVVSAEQTKQKPKTINKNCSKCGENAPSWDRNRPFWKSRHLPFPERNVRVVGEKEKKKPFSGHFNHLVKYYCYILLLQWPTLGMLIKNSGPTLFHAVALRKDIIEPKRKKDFHLQFWADS